MKALRIIYDGDCPFCASYVGFMRLREAYAVELVDARAEPATANSYGLDLNEGMIVDLEGEVFHGPRAVALLSRLSRGPGFLKSDRVADAIYPWMRGGRAIALKILGRKPL
ncbi:MAG: DCC1-like thiol-disulfide oxidoreductase family protein [Pseudomonadota bacterium]